MHVKKTSRSFRASLALVSSGALAAVALGLAVAPAASAVDALPCLGQTFDTPLSVSTCTVAPGETVPFTLSASFGGAGGNSTGFAGGRGGLGGVVQGTYTNSTDTVQTLATQVADSGVPGTFGPSGGTNGTDAGACVLVVITDTDPIPVAAVTGGAGGAGATSSANGADGANGTLIYPTELPAGWTFEARGFAASASFVPTGTIVIAGTRSKSDPTRIQIVGATTGLVGAEVTPHVKLRGQTSYTVGTGVRTVNANGAFRWSRTSNHKTYVFFTSGAIKSNLVTIAGR